MGRLFVIMCVVEQVDQQRVLKPRLTLLVSLTIHSADHREESTWLGIWRWAMQFISGDPYYRATCARHRPSALVSSQSQECRFSNNCSLVFSCTEEVVNHHPPDVSATGLYPHDLLLAHKLSFHSALSPGEIPIHPATSYSCTRSWTIVSLCIQSLLWTIPHPHPWHHIRVQLRLNRPRRHWRWWKLRQIWSLILSRLVI